MSEPKAGQEERLPKILFYFSLIFFSVCYGMVAWEKGWFHAGVARTSLQQWHELNVDEDAQLLKPRLNSAPAMVQSSGERGLTLITAKDKLLRVEVLDSDASIVQAWSIDWHSLWPNAQHLPATAIPKRQPGTHIHGAVVMPNGDLVFNFEHLGLMRLNACNDVVWRLPYRTHHSIHVNSDGELWVSGQINHAADSTLYPNYNAPFIEPTIIRVSPEGEILEEVSVMKLLVDNELQGLLYLQGTGSFKTITGGDTLHLNDVESYDSEESGFFELGDVMISLRNVNAVLVFDNKWQLKAQWTGGFVRQHDPDFIDAHRVSVYDNNHVVADASKGSSRIVIGDFNTGQIDVWFEGTEEQPFYASIMGKHQWLSPDTVLLSEPTGSRVFEVDTAGKIL